MSDQTVLWRRLVPARLADAWVERVRWAAPGPPIVTEFPGRTSARLEIYGLSVPVARTLRQLYGGEIRSLSTAAWCRSQQRDFILPVAGKLLVAAESAAIPARQQQLPVLRIPAGMAFGSGEHPTTAMCLRQLVRALRPKRARAATENAPLRMLDLGTGSGVLALAAALLGAEVVAVDLDPVCLRECRANARRNPDVPPVRWVRADVTTWQPTARADLIVANLYAEILIRIMPRLRRWLRPGGTLILSGILREQESAVTAEIIKARLTVRRRLAKGKWICLIVNPQ